MLSTDNDSLLFISVQTVKTQTLQDKNYDLLMGGHNDFPNTWPVDIQQSCVEQVATVTHCGNSLTQFSGPGQASPGTSYMQMFLGLHMTLIISDGGLIFDSPKC